MRGNEIGTHNAGLSKCKFSLLLWNSYRASNEFNPKNLSAWCELLSPKCHRTFISCFPNQSKFPPKVRHVTKYFKSFKSAITEDVTRISGVFVCGLVWFAILSPCFLLRPSRCLTTNVVSSCFLGMSLLAPNEDLISMDRWQLNEWVLLTPKRKRWKQLWLSSENAFGLTRISKKLRHQPNRTIIKPGRKLALAVY